MSRSEPRTVEVIVSPAVGGRLSIAVSGWLDASTLPGAWNGAIEAIGRDLPKELDVELSGMTYCDGAGLGLFAELRRIVMSHGGTMQFSGVRGDQKRFIEMSLLKDPLATTLEPVAAPGFIRQLGENTAATIQDLRELIAFIGELFLTLFWVARHPLRVRWRDVLGVAEKAGANALPVVCLLGLLIGVILAFQTAGPLAQYGAQPLIPTIVGISVVKEMGPLITAVIIAGRSGSAFAAEIGTMQVTEELSALKTLGLDPVRFLVVSRVLAAILVTPLLTVFNIFMSLFGAYIVMAGLGYSLSFYVNQIAGAVSYSDLLSTMFKAVVFAIIVSGIGCLRGIQTKSGPGAVGDSTTRAVVAGIVFTIAADAVMGVVFYNIGL